MGKSHIPISRNSYNPALLTQSVNTATFHVKTSFQGLHLAQSHLFMHIVNQGTANKMPPMHRTSDS